MMWILMYLLLGLGPAEAGDVKVADPNIPVDCDGLTMYICPEGQVCKCLPRPDQCLAKMQAAMQAMDRWIAWNPAQVTEMHAWMKDEILNAQRHEAILKWESTKRECWKP